MEIQPIIALLLNLYIVLILLLTVEAMERTGLKPTIKIISLRLGNFTKEIRIMIAGVMIIGLVMVMVSEQLTLL